MTFATGGARSPQTRPLGLLCKLSTLSALLSAQVLLDHTASGSCCQYSGQIGPGYCFTVTKSCLTLCIPTDFRMPGFLVLHYLPEFVQIHVHWVGELGSIPGLGRSFGGGHGNPLQYSCLENPINREAWWATVPRVAKSQTRLKWLSMHTGDTIQASHPLLPSSSFAFSLPHHWGLFQWVMCDFCLFICQWTIHLHPYFGYCK